MKTIEWILDAKNDPTMGETIEACSNYVKDNPNFNGENYINLVGLDVFDLLYTTYSETDKQAKIKEISSKPLGMRRILIDTFLFTTYGESTKAKII